YMPPGIADFTYDVAKAKQLLDEAGAKKGGDGIRTLNGRKLSWTYQTSTNDVRQKTQEIIKASFGQAGINLDLKAIDASVFFGAPDNPDSEQTFFADIEMETTGGGFYPDRWFLWFYSADPGRYICQQSNSWGAENFIRYQNPKFNTLYDQAVKEIDPAKYRPLFQQLNHFVTVEDVASYGLVARNSVSAAVSWLAGYDNRGPASSSQVWDVKSWYKKS
ncbi:MAG TPA: ABC transporter substrate-binding protein, partial [Thermomicrobiaceae bacterium]|nr:ABC transporter substrate-binding protein [Thermomicrobiaceae bacterium]